MHISIKNPQKVSFQNSFSSKGSQSDDDSWKRLMILFWCRLSSEPDSRGYLKALYRSYYWWYYYGAAQLKGAYATGSNWEQLGAEHPLQDGKWIILLKCWFILYLLPVWWERKLLPHQSCGMIQYAWLPQKNYIAVELWDLLLASSKWQQCFLALWWWLTKWYFRQYNSCQAHIRGSLKWRKVLFACQFFWTDRFGVFCLPICFGQVHSVSRYMYCRNILYLFTELWKWLMV